MERQSLFNKIRPLSWNEVVGQEFVTISLESMLINNTLPNGLLLFGTRGVGKTTISRLFARALNCTNINKDGSPCNKCPSCLMSLNNNHPDIIEISGVNSGKVDDIRSICESAAHFPISGSKYKVFIIDECHGLGASQNAWDAFLKELEEPRKHVFYIFCTTQKNKIPLTIKSRLLVFDLKLIPTKLISSYLESLEYFKTKNVEKPVFDVIALRANNSIRDALTLVELITPFLDIKGWSLANLYNIIGLFDVEGQVATLKAILDKDTIKLWSIMENAIENGVDAAEIYNSIINLINFLLSMATGCQDQWLEYKNGEVFKLYDKLEKLGLDRLASIADVVIKRKQDFDAFDNKKFVLQTTCIDLCK